MGILYLITTCTNGFCNSPKHSTPVKKYPRKKRDNRRCRTVDFAFNWTSREKRQMDTEKKNVGRPISSRKGKIIIPPAIANPPRLWMSNRAVVPITRCYNGRLPCLLILWHSLKKQSEDMYGAPNSNECKRKGLQEKNFGSRINWDMQFGVIRQFELSTRKELLVAEARLAKTSQHAKYVPRTEWSPLNSAKKIN
jgi:hypothetical protein